VISDSATRSTICAASSLTLAIKIALVTICEFVLCHIGQSLLRCEFGRLEVL
jgi:hypothetical protein